MGLFGSDDQSSSSDQINSEIETNKADIEARKQSLFQTRLDIIKGQGKENWEPSYGKSASTVPRSPVPQKLPPVWRNTSLPDLMTNKK